MNDGPRRPPAVRPTIPPGTIPDERRISWPSILDKPDLPDFPSWALISDFAGWHLQKFSFTTDASGQATVTLKAIPGALNQCFCFIAEAERHIEPIGLSGKDLTIQKRKHLYDKPRTPINGPSNLPVGTSIATGPFDTGDTSPPFSGGGGGSVDATSGSVGGGVGDAIVSVGAVSVSVSGTVDPHHHTVDQLIDHKHTLTFDHTSLDIADGETTVLLVLFQ